MSLSEWLRRLAAQPLWYLAVQIRHGSQLVRHTQSQEFVRWRTDLLAPLVLDRDTTVLWLKGGDHFHELDEADQRRLIFFEWRAISGWSHYFHMHRQGLLDEHQWLELQGLFRRVGKRQAVRATWREVRDCFDEAFRDFIDPYIEGTCES